MPISLLDKLNIYFADFSSGEHEISEYELLQECQNYIMNVESLKSLKNVKSVGQNYETDGYDVRTDGQKEIGDV